MHSYFKMVLIILVLYFNPVVYFFYRFFYKSFESSIYYIVLSVAISLLAVLGFKKISSLRFLFFVPSMLAICTLSSIFVLIVGQVIFAGRVIGYSELEWYAFTTYFGLAVLAPVFWINVFLGIVIKYLEFRVSPIKK